MRVPKVGIYKPANSPYWHLRYWDIDSGKTERPSTKETNFNSAVKVQHQKQDEIKNYVLYGIKPTAPANTAALTLSQMLNTALKAAKAFTPKHIAEKERRHKIFLKKIGADTPIDSITKDTLNTYILTRRADGMTDTTIHTELSTLRNAFNIALEAKKTTNYPFRKWKHGLKVKKTKDTYLTDTDITTLISKLKPIDDILDRLILIICTTALRLSDAASLSWDTVNGSKGFTVSKTNSTKAIYLPLSVTSILEACGESQGRVCPVSYKYESGLSKAVKDRIKKHLGKGMGAHSLRRSIATYALKNKASIKDVQEMLGHSSPTMTLEYAKANSDSARAVVDSLPWVNAAAH